MPKASKQRTEPAFTLFPSTGLIRLSGRDWPENLLGWARSGITLFVALRRAGRRLR